MCSIKKPGSKHLLNELPETHILNLLRSKFPLYVHKKHIYELIFQIVWFSDTLDSWLKWCASWNFYVAKW